jgi:hypothetical protein
MLDGDLVPVLLLLLLDGDKILLKDVNGIGGAKEGITEGPRSLGQSPVKLPLDGDKELVVVVPSVSARSTGNGV